MTTWIDIGALDDVPRLGSRVVRAADMKIAIFRTDDDRVFALEDKCPHKQGPLSQGIMHGSVVTCPLHAWTISLKTGEAQGEDRGCVPVIPLRVDAGRLYLQRHALVSARAPERAA